MTWTHYIVDATMGCRDGLLTFCPIEMDNEGNVTSILTGLMYVGFIPEGGKFYGVWHEDGDDACSAFCDEFADEIAEVSE